VTVGIRQAAGTGGTAQLDQPGTVWELGRQVDQQMIARRDRGRQRRRGVDHEQVTGQQNVAEVGEGRVDQAAVAALMSTVSRTSSA